MFTPGIPFGPNPFGGPFGMGMGMMGPGPLLGAGTALAGAATLAYGVGALNTAMLGATLGGGMMCGPQFSTGMGGFAGSVVGQGIGGLLGMGLGSSVAGPMGMVGGGMLGSILGGGIGAKIGSDIQHAKQPHCPHHGPAPQESTLNKALKGAAIGGAIGLGAAALANPFGRGMVGGFFPPPVPFGVPFCGPFGPHPF